MCVGLTSIRFSLGALWELALAAITISAIIDGIDGRIARMLESSSRFGAELDSLADMVSFGIAPAFMLYLWELHNVKVFGWGITMIFVVCMAVRLARFNVKSASTEDKGRALKFFDGIPAPASGILAVLPVIVTFGCEGCTIITPIVINHYFLVVYLLVISVLTVSRIPTFSLKNVSVPQYLESILMFFFAVTAVAFILKPWITIPILSLCYVLSIPVSFFLYSRQEHNTEENRN